MFSLILTLSSVLCSDTLLERMPGALSQIETDPDYHLVCGVNSIHQAFCSSTAPVEWYELPGKLKQITVASGSLFGVNVDNKIFYSPSAENGKVGFTPIDGSLSQVSFDGKTLCGTNSAFDVYCATENLSTNPTWVQLPGALSQVVVRGETLYGVNSINQIFYSPSVTKPVWTQLPGTLKQIQFDGNVLCGTNAEDIIYCATSLLTTNPDWTPIPGKLSAISVGGGGQLFGVNSGQQIFSGLYIPPPPPSCTSNADCSSGLVCLNPGAAGVCGNTDPEHQEVLTVQSVGQAVAKGRKLITDNDAWTKGDSVPTKVVMAHLLAPLANDAYKPVPSSVLGDWNALTPAIGGDTSHNIMKSWAWLSMTVYGNITTNRYVIAFKGTNPSRINEVLTDLYATKSSCKLQNEDCGDVIRFEIILGACRILSSVWSFKKTTGGCLN